MPQVPLLFPFYHQKTESAGDWATSEFRFCLTLHTLWVPPPSLSHINYQIQKKKGSYAPRCWHRLPLHCPYNVHFLSEDGSSLLYPYCKTRQNNLFHPTILLLYKLLEWMCITYLFIDSENFTSRMGPQRAFDGTPSLRRKPGSVTNAVTLEGGAPERSRGGAGSAALSYSWL